MQFRHDLGNDRWIVECVFPNLRGGYFVEAGATNGVNGSGTYVLEKELDWTGLGIEVQPRQFAALQKYRTCRTDNRALWSATGIPMELTVFPERSGFSGLTSVNKNLTNLAAEQKELITVETITLQDALVQHNAPRDIHFICLDVEGAEPEILKNFPFNEKFEVLALSIEGHQCDEIMKGAGYLATKNPFTDVTFETYWLHPRLAHLALS